MMELEKVRTRNYIQNNDPTNHQSILYMDLDKTINKVLNYMGRYQILLFAAFSLNSLVYGINHTLASFHSYTPKFYCKDDIDAPNSCKAVNNTCPSGFEFDEHEDYTIVSQWSLVCDRGYLAPLVSTLYYTGVTFGAIICGIFCDKFGRKAVVVTCLISQGVLGLSLRFITIYEVFVVLRTLQGFFVQGIQGSCVALLFEYTPPRFRTTAIIVWHVGFTLGSLLLASISYGVRDWRMLQIYISIPTLIFICYMWAVPESLFWLYASNRKQKALERCLRTAELNKDQNMVDEIKTMYKIELETAPNDTENDETKHELIIEKASLWDLCKSPPLRKHLSIMVIVNYIISIAFYSCMFFVNRLFGDHHLNYIITSVADLIAFPVVFYLLKYYGTRFTIMLYMYSGAFFCLVIGLIIIYIPDSYPNKAILVIVILVICKTLAIDAFTVKVLYNAELFPTICRGAALGTNGFFARIGSVSAPFFMTLADIYSPIVPMSTLAVAYFISATSIFLLPDTRTQLPHSISEANILWGKKK